MNEHITWQQISNCIRHAYILLCNTETDKHQKQNFKLQTKTKHPMLKTLSPEVTQATVVMQSTSHPSQV